MRILGRVLGYREPLERELDEIRERIGESDDRLEQARKLTRDAERRLSLVEARVRIRERRAAG